MSDAGDDEKQEEKPNHGVYEGERDESKRRHGKGLAVFPNGDKYEGEYFEGKRQGKGVYTYAKDGSVYEGDFLNNKKHGFGVFKFKEKPDTPELQVYEGNWFEDKKHGYGTYTYSNKDTYTGEWKEGLRHGDGSYFFADTQTSFVGHWENGDFATGKWVYPDGTIFEGPFSQNVPCGPGTFEFLNGNQLHGLFSLKKQSSPVLPPEPIWKGLTVTAPRAQVQYHMQAPDPRNPKAPYPPRER